MARINNDTRVVVALGGNALGDTPEEQIARVREAAPTLLRMIEQGNEIIITHGNGPQVGMIQKAFTLAAEEDPKVPAMPLPECGAMSQGYIGYHLQQALGVAMHKSYKRWHVASIVTQMEVDPGSIRRLLTPPSPLVYFLPRSRRRRKWLNIPTKCLWRILAADGAGL